MASHGTKWLLVLAPIALVVWFLVWREEPGVSHAPPSELIHILESVMPSGAHDIAPLTFDGGQYSVSGFREFEVDMDWDEYRNWVKSRLAPDWRPFENAGDLSFSKATPGDRYSVSLAKMSATRPIRIRVTALAAAD
jgi:hypothetical protein